MSLTAQPDSSVMTRIIFAIADRFFLLRPLVLVPAVTFFLLGYRDAREGAEAGQGPFLLAAVCYALLMGSVYVVNQIADIESDKANEKLFVLHQGMVSSGEAIALAVVLSVVSMAVALTIGGRTALYFGLSLLLGLAYSVPPVALKRRFPFDLLANALGYGVLAYASGWSVVEGSGHPEVMRAVPFALCVGGVFVLTALADREGDESSGFKSTGVVLTPIQCAILALFLVALALPVALLVRNQIAAAGSIVSLPLFAYAALRVGPRAVKIAYRCGSAIFVLIVGLLHPVFLVVVLVVLGLARLYYSRRFALNYPSIAGR